MYIWTLHFHSALRYIVLFLLLIVVLKSFTAWRNNKPFTKGDNIFSLLLLISTHTQLLLGLLLYYLSPFVQFSGSTMKDAGTRYWTVEHIFGMLIAVALITVARTSQKKLPTDTARHKRLFILNGIALLIIIIIIAASGRGLFGMTGLG